MALTPYRVIVCQQVSKTTGRGPKRKTTMIGSAFVAWNPDASIEPGRLANSGSFLWPGIHAARAVAMDYLTQLGTTYHQVQVRTNQDRTVYLWNKSSDGRITGYAPDPRD